MKLPDDVGKLDDDEWLNLLIKSVSNPIIESVEFPRFPPKDTQARFVGSSDETSLREAFRFYSFVKKHAQHSGSPLRQDHKLLDFGCGWGRFLRFFWKDIDPNNLFGCDVDIEILNVCRETKVPGQFACITPSGKLPFPDNFFNVIVSYSVFTHLPENINLHWMRELARVSAPGCLFFLTLEPRRFIHFVANLPENPPNRWHKALSRFSQESANLYEKFDAGEIVYLPTGAGIILNNTVYGDAVVPLTFIEKHWSSFFSVREYIDDPKQFGEAVLAVQKTTSSKQNGPTNLLLSRKDIVLPSTVIHPEDTMWKTGDKWYFTVGQSALKVINHAIDLSQLPKVESILDLPCGHGRVARYLRAGYPGAKIYFCDLSASGVEFCANTFSGIGIMSQPDLTKVKLPKVDVIWIGSLFTHVDLSRIKTWMTYLADHLTPNGVLIATLHGEFSISYHERYRMIDPTSWNTIIESYKKTGFGYARYREMDMGDYGISLIRPSVMCDIVSDIPGVRLLGYVERGWSENHDVVMITKNDRLKRWW